MGKYGKKAFLGRRALILCLCIALLAGCGEARVPDVIDTPSVALGKEGDVTVWQVGLFDKADYVVSELQAMALEEAGQYNLSVQKEAAVAVEKVEALGDGSQKVVVEYKFDGWESCTAFLEEELFFGTVTEAAISGMDANVPDMKSVKDGTRLETGLSSQGDSYLVATDMKVNVYCPGKVTYISDGAQVNEDGSISTAGVEGTAYILYK